MSWRAAARWGAMAAVVVAAAACEKEPPDLRGGHVTWLDGSGQTRYALRAKPYGFRVLGAGGEAWGRIRRERGETALEGPGRPAVVAQLTPDGLQVRDPAGAVRVRVQQTPAGLLLFDRAGAPLGRVGPTASGATVANAGGLPIGTVRLSGGVLVQRSRDGAVTGSLLGTTDAAAAALLMLDDVPLEDRLALLALRLERR